MFSRKFTVFLGLIAMMSATLIACQTGGSAGSGPAPVVQNKLHLDPQMSWPVQWDKVKGKPGYFWVAGQNSGIVTIWDDTTFKKVALIDFGHLPKLVQASKR